MPQIINQITPPIKITIKVSIIPVMILRFLLIGFLGFLDFLLVSSIVFGSAAFNSPLCSSNSKACTGLRKSSVELCGVGFDCGVGLVEAIDWGSVELVVMSRDFGLLMLDFVLRRIVLGDLVVVLAGFVMVFADFWAVLVGEVLVLRVIVADFLERRVTSPSIDLFLSIVYNYNIMAIKLTKKQLALLNYLEDFTEENGYSPSYREIVSGLGLSSVSAVAEHINNLVNKGVLKKVPGAARSLEVLDYKHEETVELFKIRLADCTEEEKDILKKAADILGLDLGE